jgi:hypothetical protein
MARRKLARVLDLEKGLTRLAAVKSIDVNLDLGNNITTANYQTVIDALQTKLSAYNTALSTVDDLYNDCIAQIDLLKDWNERVLTGVATKYGKNNSQYEMAGGVRKSERKKSKSSGN